MLRLLAVVSAFLVASLAHPVGTTPDHVIDVKRNRISVPQNRAISGQVNFNHEYNLASSGVLQVRPAGTEGYNWVELEIQSVASPYLAVIMAKFNTSEGWTENWKSCWPYEDETNKVPVKLTPGATEVRLRIFRAELNSGQDAWENKWLYNMIDAVMYTIEEVEDPSTDLERLASAEIG